MRSYEMYIFDLDDTLTHTFRTATTAYYPRLARILGLAYPGNDVVRQHWGEDLFASLERIFGVSVDRGTALAHLRKLHEEEPVQAVDGAHCILDVLKKHGKFVGLYSSSEPALLDASIRYGLSRKRGDFHFIFSAVEQQIAKPSPHIAFVMMEKYRQLFGAEVELDNVLVVGDAVADFFLAKNARLNFAGVLTGTTSREEFLHAGLEGSGIFRSIKEALTPPPDHGVVAIIRDERSRFLLIQEPRPGHVYSGHWSGPHGICEPEDIIEEETVARETREECGVAVKAVRKLYTCPADTKVKTVSFWEAKLLPPGYVALNMSNREVGAIAWFTLEDILAEKMALYPGTKDFFKRYAKEGM